MLTKIDVYQLLYAFFQICEFAHIGFRSSSSFLFSAISPVASDRCFGFERPPCAREVDRPAIGLGVMSLFPLIGRAMSLVATGGGRFGTLALSRRDVFESIAPGNGVDLLPEWLMRIRADLRIG